MTLVFPVGLGPFILLDTFALVDVVYFLTSLLLIL